MDIAGAKALKERLGPHRPDDASSGLVDVPEDAPPVYHYLGVGDVPPETPADEPRLSWLRRLRRFSR
jgi:hypothetical protein